MDTDYYLGVCAAARLLGVSPQAVRRRIGRGQLPAVRDRVSRRYRIPRAAVLAQLEDVRPAPEVRARPLAPHLAAVAREFGLL